MISDKLHSSFVTIAKMVCEPIMISSYEQSKKQLIYKAQSLLLANELCEYTNGPKVAIKLKNYFNYVIHKVILFQNS